MKTSPVGFYPNLWEYVSVLIAVTALMLAFPTVHAQIPGIPEPGVVMYGQVRSATDNSLQTIASMTLSLNDGTGATVSLSGTSTPPIKFVSINSQSFYVARIPFDTRVIGTGQNQTTFDPPGNSFQLKATSPTYTRSGTVNGQAATFASTGQTSNTFMFTAAERGRVEQVDLKITVRLQDYNTWAMGYFSNLSSPDAQPGADPDGDGLTNAQELAAGTNPLDPLSALKAVTLQPTPTGGFTITWKSVSGKTYVIEKATDNQLQNWNQITQITANDTTTSYTDPASETDVTAHYRIRANSQ